ncbi:MBOAT family O-acyltransferase [Butyrivibrio sp. VCD2006]|uniref:MBOAT family O-acyltransferase n=1 Tax=Butyrivibrio sp. VCD2006 TaxID=1280664 RepID=UPI00041C2047|nr:MBOAT family O-acyltransferase [Butyrivibrio sp. VCD2006]
MQFNSYIFILCFLPLSLILYFLFHDLGKRKLAYGSLLVMSLWFYGYFNPYYLAIICSSIIVNFLLSRAMATKGSEEGSANVRKKVCLIAGLLFNIGLIFYFKYYDFFIENINAVFRTGFNLKHIVLPLGISFFTFQQISFIVDSYRGETGDYSFLEYALFVSYFPQLVAGPIVLHSELIPQFRDEKKHRVNFDNLCRGIMLFTRGLGKKMLIADMFGRAVDFGFSQAALIPVGEGALTRPEIIIVMLSYTFQIYFDFSGYSDMATGLGAMFNLDIPMNFNSPYKAISIADFWKRWHMTLTRFLTNYVYIPLGGNRKGKVRTYINTFIVFLVSGIWHGANWTFILWGVFHGFFQCINKLTHEGYVRACDSVKKGPLGRVLAAVIKAVSWTLTFGIINVLWLLFRADSVSQWIQILKRLFVLNLDVRSELVETFRIPRFRYVLSFLRLPSEDLNVLLTGCGIAMAAALIVCLCCKNNYEREYKTNALSLAFTWVLLVVCIVSMSSISTFLYFNF